MTKAKIFDVKTEMSSATTTAMMRTDHSTTWKNDVNNDFSTPNLFQINHAIASDQDLLGNQFHNLGFIELFKIDPTLDPFTFNPKPTSTTTSTVRTTTTKLTSFDGKTEMSTASTTATSTAAKTATTGIEMSTFDPRTEMKTATTTATTIYTIMAELVSTIDPKTEMRTSDPRTEISTVDLSPNPILMYSGLE